MYLPVVLALPLLAVRGATSADHLQGARELQLLLPIPGTPQWAVAALRKPGLTNAEQVQAIERLGRYKNSALVVDELIRWLECEPIVPGDRFFSLRPLPELPAVEALKQVGPFAAPQLVTEYLYFFENDALSAREGRYSRLCADHTGEPYPTQDPSCRLWALSDAMRSSPEMASAVVKEALKRSQAAPRDVRVQRACRELIERVTSSFPAADRVRLFPDLIPSP
ncbi:MAG: hypothetical protein K2X82_27610 [Gemmataceae bacterium]|nr:hypothetical protein [Gemmataceae bacterium]